MISAITSFTPQPAGIRKPAATPSAKTEIARPAAAKPAAPALKPFAEVARDARAALDAGYERAGRGPEGKTHLTGKEWFETVGLEKLDRRTLFAIVSNAGGQFSKREISAAGSMIARQESEIMGLDRPGHRPNPKSYKDLIEYYDTSVSPEEKATLQWAQGRAGAQWVYETMMREEGKKPENFDSKNPVVNLFLTSIHEFSALNDPDADWRDTPSYRKAVALWVQQNKAAQPTTWRF